MGMTAEIPVADHRTGRFQAMGSPCEVLIDTDDGQMARRLVETAAVEARRVEAKFSRYRPDSVLSAINRRAGTDVTVDGETALLLDFAAAAHRLSEGRFDVTTGVLRRVWRFEGASQSIDTAAVEQLRPFIGWHRVSWRSPVFKMPEGFELDLGGVAKEYATDRILGLLRRETDLSVLVNLGGDIAAAGGRLWTVGIENDGCCAQKTLALRRGGIATSGSARRWAMANGRRRCHILDPRTGWPVENAPWSVTVAASTCSEAGFFSTVAMTHGPAAETFLKEQGVTSWCQRPNDGRDG